MTCGSCIRWRRREKPARWLARWITRFGWCRWPGFKPAPYWHAQHPGGELMVADCHGLGCAAFKQKRG